MNNIKSIASWETRISHTLETLGFPTGSCLRRQVALPYSTENHRFSGPLLGSIPSPLRCKCIAAKATCISIAGRLGIGPRLKASKASVLPLDDLPNFFYLLS